MRNASHGHTYSCGKYLGYFAIQLVEWTFFFKTRTLNNFSQQNIIFDCFNKMQRHFIQQAMKNTKMYNNKFKKNNGCMDIFFSQNENTSNFWCMPYFSGIYEGKKLVFFEHRQIVDHFNWVIFFVILVCFVSNTSFPPGLEI